MEYRRLDTLARASRSEVQAAIEEILADINVASSSPAYTNTIRAWFEHIDALRCQLSLRGDQHIPRIQQLIMEGCKSDAEDFDLSDGRNLTDHERTVYNALSELGCIVLRNGWPDFLAIHRESGRIFGVEAKSGQTRVRSDQRMIHRILKKAGVPVIIARDPKTITRQLNRGA